jgi:hypothetical protein
MTIPLDSFDEWAILRDDVDKFSARTRKLLFIGYFLFVTGVFASAIGGFEFVVVIALTIILHGIFMHRRVERLEHIIDTHQRSIDEKTKNKDSSSYHFNMIDKAEIDPALSSFSLSIKGFLNKQLSFSDWLIKMKEETEILKLRADNIYSQTALVYLVVNSIVLPHIDSSIPEKIGAWSFFLCLIFFVPTYLLPFQMAMVICFDLVSVIILEFNLLSLAAFSFSECDISLIVIAVTAAYRIKAICLGFQAKKISQQLKAISLSSKNQYSSQI